MDLEAYSFQSKKGVRQVSAAAVIAFKRIFAAICYQ
jgi:hypothetical protein